MIALLLFIVFGLLFGYFATLNTSFVTIYFGIYTAEHISLYLVVLLSFGTGVLFATLFYFIKFLSSKFMISRREGEIVKATKENAELMKKIHQLEIENTRLKTKTGEQSHDDDSL